MPRDADDAAEHARQMIEAIEWRADYLEAEAREERKKAAKLKAKIPEDQPNA